MRIVITAAAGMLGHDLAARLSMPPGRHQLHLIDRPECDITDASAVRQCLDAARPEAVIHVAAYTDVDGCERNPALAMRVNGDGTRNIAEAAARVGARLLYISTDYIFDGAKREPYLEDDPPNPLSAYGRSKLAGEYAVRDHPDSLVVRTAWLYGLHGRHFIGAILERAGRGEPLRVVNDQVGSPTWTCHLSNALAELVELPARGIVHVTGSGTSSWYEFTVAIVEEAAARGLMEPVPVAAMTTSELSRPAPRPAYSVLSNERLRKLGIAPLPHWREALGQFLTLWGSRPGRPLN